MNVMTNYISVGQRNEKSNFNASFQNSKDQGIANLLSGYNRQNFRMNLDLELHPKLDLRINLAAQDAGGRPNYARRDFVGITVAMQYRPFRNTTIDMNAEVGRTDEVRQQVMFSEAYSTSDLTGSSYNFAISSQRHTRQASANLCPAAAFNTHESQGYTYPSLLSTGCT